jgi:hypothetical protein
MNIIQSQTNGFFKWKFDDNNHHLMRQTGCNCLSGGNAEIVQ